MRSASCLAGMAFSNALLGISHSLAHKTGAAFSTGHIPHGEANAIYLPYVIKINAKAAGSRYADIARFIGLPGNSEAALTYALCEKVEELDRKMGIPSNLKDFGVDEKEFKEKAHDIAALAMTDACTGSNPRDITVDEMERLLNCIYYRKPVDF